MGYTEGMESRDIPLLVSWQLGLWAWGEHAFLERLESAWKTRVVDRSSPPYNPASPRAGFWASAAEPITSLGAMTGHRCFGATLFRPKSERGFFSTIATRLEALVALAPNDSSANLVCITVALGESPEQPGFLKGGVFADSEPDYGFVLLGPGRKATGTKIEMVRSVARSYALTKGDDPYSPTEFAAITSIWLNEFKGPKEFLAPWKIACRAQVLDRELPSPPILPAVRPRF